MKRYSKEFLDFLRENVSGRTVQDLVNLANEKYDYKMTLPQMRALKSNRGLRNGMKTGLPAGRATKAYPREVKDYIQENHKGVGHIEMAQRLNEKFGTNYKASQINSYYGNHGLSSGLSGYFKKGHVPVNKGKKGEYPAGCEKGWFQKGHESLNRRELGSERVDRDGYTLVKTKEPRTWTPKHKVLWIEANGPVPKGSKLVFLDGDKSNITLNNLTLVTDSELLLMNRNDLIYEDPELTKTGVNIARVLDKVHGRKKEARK